MKQKIEQLQEGLANHMLALLENEQELDASTLNAIRAFIKDHSHLVDDDDTHKVFEQFRDYAKEHKLPFNA